MYDSRIYSNLFDPGDLVEFGTLLPHCSSPEYQYNNNNNNDIPPGEVIGYYLKRDCCKRLSLKTISFHTYLTLLCQFCPSNTQFDFVAA
jgi:hypothetical protein